ncbi:hypothetical protein B0T10DRAFT_136167 [Thelonectria olida]|uniref:Zn(2)-C6 fungal-type domain-containing protein n=1 Tax=Thelonectria olida TaxID=1576542 RepID=A0A9P8W0S2_9HYPO|nr:hypothetical protein B0T10DRAFT_136167 [Thelonectria olida]
MTPVTRTQKMRSACDRCYKLKERCERRAHASCERCHRLDIACSTSPAIQPSGRRLRRNDDLLEATSKDFNGTGMVVSDTRQLLPNVDTWSRDALGLTSAEKELLTFLLDRTEYLRHFVAYSSFTTAAQQSLTTLLLAAIPVLKDAYLAYASAMKCLQPDLEMEMHENNGLRYASSAMSIMRSFRVDNLDDAISCLTLGTVLATSIYSMLGVGVADICQFCLSATSSLTKLAQLDPASESYRNFLVLLETQDCLVNCRVPTIRASSHNQEIADPRLGICSTLLPHYYDLCAISHSLVNATDASFLALLYEQLSTVQASIDEWQPSCSGSVVSQFVSTEIIHLLAQAKVYRLAALLISHRLRYLFGEQDDQASIWSKEIMMELAMARKMATGDLRFVTMPFLVAAIEVRQHESRNVVLQNVDKYVDCLTPTVQRAAKRFLLKIWDERDKDETRRWFDSVSIPCPTLHAIDSRYFP